MCHKLRIIRQELGLTMQDVHELTGVSVTTIGDIERGNKEHKVHEDVALLLARGLYLEVADIFDPLETSPYGRPPLTGGRLKKANKSTPTENCCSYELPLTGVCDRCGSTKKSRALRQELAEAV